MNDTPGTPVMVGVDGSTTSLGATRPVRPLVAFSSSL
jgi:hypothetical protein